MPETIDKLVTTITRLEKLKARSPRDTQPAPAVTRHRVELSIVPSNFSVQTTPKVIELTATTLPPHETEPK